MEALEQRSGVDARRLARGRTYAGQDRVLSLAVEPGVVAASVRGSRRLNYRTHLDVRTYDDEHWARVIDVVARRGRHVAAPLDGDLDPGLLDDAREAGVELLPTPGDLRPRCSCPDDVDPCKHAAALAYVVAAEAVDDDPFVLFHLRGRSRPALLDDLRAARRPEGAADDDGPELVLGTGPDPGEPARDAWARERTPLPALADVPPEPGRPAAWPDDPPADAPFDTPGPCWRWRPDGFLPRRAWNRKLRGDGDLAEPRPVRTRRPGPARGGRPRCRHPVARDRRPVGNRRSGGSGRGVAPRRQRLLTMLAEPTWLAARGDDTGSRRGRVRECRPRRSPSTRTADRRRWLAPAPDGGLVALRASARPVAVARPAKRTTCSTVASGLDVVTVSASSGRFHVVVCGASLL